MAWQENGVNTSDRKARLPANWYHKDGPRQRILKRDNYMCTVRRSDSRPCGNKATEVDHIIAGDDHSDENLRAICTWHHRRKSSAEGNAAHKPRPPRNLPKERHPSEGGY